MPHKCVLKGKTKHGKHSCNPVYYISQCICLFWSIIKRKQEFKLTLNIKSCKTQEIKALDVHQFIYNLIRTWLWFLHGLRWLSQILKPIFFFKMSNDLKSPASWTTCTVLSGLKILQLIAVTVRLINAYKDDIQDLACFLCVFIKMVDITYISIWVGLAACGTRTQLHTF